MKMSYEEVKKARYNDDGTISLFHCSNNCTGPFTWGQPMNVEGFLNGAEFTHDNSCIEGNGNWKWVGKEENKPDWWPLEPFKEWSEESP